MTKAKKKKATKKVKYRVLKRLKHPEGFSARAHRIGQCVSTKVSGFDLLRKACMFPPVFKKLSLPISSIVGTMTEKYAISEIGLTASFNADGKFLGFGVGGAASITIKITPSS